MMANAMITDKNTFNNVPDLPAFVTPIATPMRPLAPRHARGLIFGSPIRRAVAATSRRVVCLQPVASAERRQTESAAKQTENLERAAAQLYSIDATLLQSDDEERLRGFIKTRFSLNPSEDVVYFFTGEVYAVVEGRPTTRLFGVDGFSAARAVPIDGGWRMLTREVAAYVDGPNREPLTTWRNAQTDCDVAVVHVWNDPVNHDLTSGTSIMTTQLGDSICWSVDAFPRYQSPLPASEFPSIGGSEMYESAELFSFVTGAEDLKSELPSSPACLSWSRIGPWLPWMQMGERPGHLVYHCRGHKLQHGFEDLPNTLKQLVMQNNPHFAEAPRDFKQPNETSWTYMRKLIERKGYPRADGRIARAASPQEKSSESLPPKQRAQSNLLRLTRRQLHAFRGRYGEDITPIYISIAGRIFDVSSARRHYGFGETYNILSGTDASHALLTGSLSSNNDVPFDMTQLSEEDRNTLDKWVTFFSKSYEQVGILVDL